MNLRKSLGKDRKARKGLNQLVELGCDYELANERYAVLNVPPSIDIGRIELTVNEITTARERADPMFEDSLPI